MFPPGGSVDQVARILAQSLSQQLGQSVIVENRGGASGSIGTAAVVQAPADGYTFAVVFDTHGVNPALNPNLPYDTKKDLTPLVLVGTSPMVLATHVGSEYKTFKDVVDAAKAKKNVSFGTIGNGSLGHLAMALLGKDANMEMTHIPYKGTTDQMLALASGNIMAGVNSTGFAPWVEQGKLRLLAVFSDKRSNRWPAVPTMKELGFAQSVYHSPWGLVAPSGTPAAIVKTLHDAFRAAMFTPRHLHELQRYDQDAAYLDSPSYKQTLLQIAARERQLLQRMKLLAE